MSGGRPENDGKVSVYGRFGGNFGGIAEKGVKGF